jgi:coproporphyrinogen III oxidase-like Fe-S oxidoreductase
MTADKEALGAPGTGHKEAANENGVSGVIRQNVAGAEVLDAIRQELGRNHLRRRLLVYVHIPFCSSKCTFCGWVAGISAPQLRSADDIRAQYVSSLLSQIEYYAPRLMTLGYSPEIVYWGGGTPSILSPAQMTSIGNALRENFDLSGVYEYAVESSPETLTAEKIQALQAAGMNRLSIGVQSFDDDELHRAGRAHSSRTAEEAIQLVRQQGCRNLNVDIITGFPGQSPDVLERTIAKTVQLHPEHVTAYSYYIVNETVMARQLKRGYRSGLNTEQRAIAQDYVYEALTESGYTDYMPMYYSITPGYQFSGESYYFDWLGDYIGFGSGANSVLAHHGLGCNRGNLARYISSPTAFDQVRRMSIRDALGDIFGSLVTSGRPVNYERFRARFGFDFEAVLTRPRFKALQRVLERLGTPLILDSSEAYISAPDGCRHGGDWVRQSDNVWAIIEAALSRRQQLKEETV